MLKRGKKASAIPISPHKQVTYGFLIIIVISTLYVLFVPQSKMADAQVIDDTQIMVHNGMGHQFRHGHNRLFEGQTNTDVKTLFMSALSDTNQIGQCKSSKVQNQDDVANEEEIEVPEFYDWRKEYPHCVQPVQSIGTTNCSASYALASLSTVADRICMSSNNPITLSA